MTLSELIDRRLRDYGMGRVEASREMGLAGTAMTRLIERGDVDISPRVCGAICRVLDIAPRVLEAAIRAQKVTR